MGTTAARRDRAPSAAAMLGSGADGSPQAPARLSGAVTAVLLASTTTILLATGTLHLLPTAISGHGEAALLAWVLSTAALLGALLSAYLVVVWSIAALALALGPASRAGRSLVGALRVIAPHLARRVTLGAAIASTATGLVLVPATAATVEDPNPVRVGAASATWAAAPAALLPHETPERAGGSPQPDRPGEQQDPATGPSDTGDLPALGWGQQPGPAAPSEPAPGSPPDDAGMPGGTEAPKLTLVTVRPGDSLWSITDDLIGPGDDPPEVIASSWPALYEANRDLIGPDPDSIVPGQELVVPTTLSSQEQP